MWRGRNVANPYALTRFWMPDPSNILKKGRVSGEKKPRPYHKHEGPYVTGL